MGLARKHELDKRLADYCATLRSSRLEETRKRRSGNWQVYAAVTGSALAMATSASAGTISIINSSLTGNVTAGPLPNISNLNHTSPSFSEHKSQSIQLTNGKGGTIGVGFNIGVGQRSVDSGKRASAVLLGGSQVGFLHSSKYAFFVKDLASATKTNHTGVFQKGTNFVATQGDFSFAGVDPISTRGWSKNATGFAGFSFTYKGNTDYGWVQLRYTLGSNGLINEIEAEGSASPEPSTFALALLAAGAAGVAALRRRRKAAA